MIVLQLQEMNVPIYPRKGANRWKRRAAGMTGGGKRLIGRLSKNHVKAVVIIAALFVASNVLSLKISNTGGGRYLPIELFK